MQMLMSSPVVIFGNILDYVRPIYTDNLLVGPILLLKISKQNGHFPRKIVRIREGSKSKNFLIHGDV